MKFRRKELVPGQRKNADQIISSVMKWDVAILLTIGIAVGLFSYIYSGGSSGLSATLGIFVVALSNLISWGFYLRAGKKQPKYQGFVTASLFVVKLVLLAIVISYARLWAIVDLRAMLVGFAGALILSLLISSVLVMKQPGPDFEFNSDPVEY
ncbi:hypothetical protein [Arcanobacterium ihumii]|uniref:hypothetical protein n=1 Tax=Arcanobacterium ihumii TaxID=2138162 RepID=UPI001F2D3DBE|nr:hypothetical protein [Arcanobacterium ihumii]